eukprot:1195485-Prorocentrum_minimum.AAC.4
MVRHSRGESLVRFYQSRSRLKQNSPGDYVNGTTVCRNVGSGGCHDRCDFRTILQPHLAQHSAHRELTLRELTHRELTRTNMEYGRSPMLRCPCKLRGHLRCVRRVDGPCNACM